MKTKIKDKKWDELMEKIKPINHKLSELLKQRDKLFDEYENDKTREI